MKKDVIFTILQFFCTPIQSNIVILLRVCIIILNSSTSFYSPLLFTDSLLPTILPNLLIKLLSKVTIKLRRSHYEIFFGLYITY